MYCETCVDSDRELGEFETIHEFWDLISDKVSINGSGGMNLQYILPIVNHIFDYPFLVKYEDEYYRDIECCCNSEEDILYQVNKAIIEEQNNKCVKE